MRLVVFIGLLALNLVVASQGVNTDKVILEHNKKINSLIANDRVLKGRIEGLEKELENSNKKIEELFFLLKFKKSDKATKDAVIELNNSNKKTKKLYTDARSLLATNQYEQAIVLFEEYLAKYKNHDNAADAAYWLAKSYLAIEDYQKAKQAFIDFQNNNPINHKFANSLFEMARVYIGLKNNNKALELLKTIINKFPHHNIVNKAKKLITDITPKVKK